MMKLRAKAKQQKERGMALLLALFALLLLSAIGLFMVLASNTETHIDANYSNGLRSYYAARSGLEEVRDRVKYPSTPTNPTGSGLSDLLPQDVAGNAGGVLYVLNPASGETVDPTDPTSPYFDDQLCHDYASGVAAKDTKCSMLPGTPNWNKTVASVTASTQPGYNPSTQLAYKWIRINMKTNRIADPYFVDNNLTGAPLDTRVCFDGQTEQLSPGGTNPSCDANGMQTVYMLTSLAATPQTGGPNGSRKLMRVEVVAPSIRPPGALTLGASTTAPALINSSSSIPGIPTIAIDGRPHDIHGILSSSASCSMIAPLATDTPAGTAQLEQSLNLVRRGIVNQANTACNPDGSNTLIGNICTAGLWWVRGTNPLSRFIVTGSSTSTPGSGTSTSTSSTSGSTPGGSGRGGRDDDDSHGGHHHNDPSGAPDPTGACAATDPSCFTNLDLAAPELFATSALTGTDIPVVAPPADGIAPFTGGKGNQSDASIYQPASASIIANEIKAVTDFASASTSDPSYYTVSSATLAASYGTSSNPAIVVFTDPTLSLQNNAVGLSGYGVLVISNGSLEITNAALNWNGIVVIQSPTGHVTLNSATGSINGALLLQPGAALSLQNSSTAVCGTGQLCTAFRLTYSCDAIDLAFTSKPFKIISTQGTSF